jgi:hypothetical protein
VSAANVARTASQATWVEQEKLLKKKRAARDAKLKDAGKPPTVK